MEAARAEAEDGRRRVGNEGGSPAGPSGLRREVGARGEDLAVAELQRQGMQVVARNWRCRLGEIDVVAVDVVQGRRTLVFCEVKCRTGLGFGAPLESITHTKLRKLRQLAAHWLATEPLHADDIRLDAIGVVLLPGCRPELTHVRGIG
jgi:putative endonuclease